MLLTGYTSISAFIPNLLDLSEVNAAIKALQKYLNANYLKEKL